MYDAKFWKDNESLELTYDGEVEVVRQLLKLNARCIVCQTILVPLTIQGKTIIVCAKEPSKHTGVTFKIDSQSRIGKPRVLGKGSVRGRCCR